MVDHFESISYLGFDDGLRCIRWNEHIIVTEVFLTIASPVWLQKEISSKFQVFRNKINNLIYKYSLHIQDTDKWVPN